MSASSGAGLRCGRISYTNDLPVYAAFDAGEVDFPGSLVEGVPAALNRGMLAGELDCGPISSFFYAEHADEFVLLPDVCIGSRDAVRSIYCLSAGDPRDLAGTRVAVTRESATGRALFRTICRSYFGFDPVYVESDDPLGDFDERAMPAVLIGDRAIDAYLRHPDQAHDLGSLWRECSGHEMVYAVWVIRREAARRSAGAAAAITAALNAGLAWGLANLEAVIARAQASIPRPVGFYQAYYQALNFRFDESARRGLRAFFDASVACGVLPSSPAFAFADEELERV